MARYTDEQFQEIITPQASGLPKDDLPKTVESGESPSFFQGVASAFKTENVIGSFFTYGYQDKYSTNPNYDPFTKLVEMGRPELAEDAGAVDNDEELANYVSFRDKQIADHTVLDELGWVGMTLRMGASGLDPFFIVPGAGALKAATKLASITKGVFKTGGIAGATAAAQEGVLTAQQNEKQLTGVAYAAIGGVVLGGMLGGAAGALTKNSADATNKLIATVLETGKEPKVRIAKQGDSAGAARVEGSELKHIEETKHAEGLYKLNETFAKNVSGLFGKWSRSPLINGATSRFAATRKMTNMFFENSLIINKNAEGVASSTAAETLIKRDLGDLALKTNALKGLYFDYIGVSKGAFKDARSALKARKSNTLTYEQFNGELDKALRNNDVHKIPQVQKAAQLIRKDLDDVLKGMKETGLITKELDVKGAESYFRRSYNIRAIQENREEFEEILFNHFSKKISDFSEAKIQAHDTTNNILGLGDNSIGLSAVNPGSSTKILKERTLDIPDEEIAAYLGKDAISNYSSYMAQASGLINLKKVLRENGYETLGDIKKELRDEFTIRTGVIRKERDKVGSKLTENKASKMLADESKSLNSNLKQVTDWADLVTGRVGQPKNNMDKFLKNLRKVNTTRLLGGMAISALPDLAMPVIRNGFLRTLKDGYIPMIRSIKASKLAKEEYKNFNVGLELMQNETLRILSDGDFALQSGKTALDNVMDSTVDLFGKMTLNTHWTFGGKRLSAHIISARMFEAADKFVNKGSIPKSEVIRLAQLGISTDDLPKIFEQFQKFGQKRKGSYIADFASWTDKDLRDKFGNAIMKEVDATVITPGRGDIPFFFQSNQVAKTIFQFKSFTAAASNKILLSGLQRRDAHMLLGSMYAMALGTMSWAIKQAISGKDITELSDDDLMSKFVTEGMPRSGVSSLMTDVGFALNPYMQTSRYAGMNAQSYILGPSGNLIGDVFSSLNDVADGEMTGEDAGKISRMLPFQNLFWLRAALDKVNEEK